jgi:hypothetical protein
MALIIADIPTEPDHKDKNKLADRMLSDVFLAISFTIEFINICVSVGRKTSISSKKAGVTMDIWPTMLKRNIKKGNRDSIR